MERRRSEQVYEVDGVTYQSLDDVPEPHRSSLRRLLADADGDGVPDLFEEAGTTNVSTTTTSTQIEIDGVTYRSLDDVPASHRELVERLLDPSEPPPEPAPPSGSATAPPPAAPDPIVTRSGFGRRRLLAAFIAMDAVAVGVLVWLLTR